MAYGSTAEVFDAIERALTAQPQRTQGTVASFTLIVDGAPWHLTISDGTFTSGPGAAAAPNVIITTDEQTFVAIANGTLDPQIAYLRRKLKVNGQLTMLSVLMRVLQ